MAGLILLVSNPHRTELLTPVQSRVHMSRLHNNCQNLGPQVYISF